MRWLWTILLFTASALAQNQYGSDYLILHGSSPDANSRLEFGNFPRPGFAPSISPPGSAVLYFDSGCTCLKVSNNGGAYASFGGSGTVSANNGVVNAVATYSAAGGSTTIAPAAAGVACLPGATSGSACLTAPAIAGTLTNPIASSNSLSLPSVSAFNASTPVYGVAGAPIGVFLGTQNGGTVGIGTPSGFIDMIFDQSHGPVIASNVPLMWANAAGLATSVTVDTSINRGAAGVVCAGKTNAGPDCTGGLEAATYLTGTNCAAVGTAANPSVASCTAASAGSFSCATNASAGTCTVNTTVVTANSEIFITQRTDATTGTRLGVTCNTTIDTVQRAVTAVTAATSFTINLGTITTNPECFSYSVVN